MNRFQRLLWVSIGCYFATGCLMTRDQIRGAAGSDSSKQQSQITQMQLKEANETARMDEFDEQFRLLRGRLDVVENQVSQVTDEAAKEDQNKEAINKEELDTKLKAFEEALRSMEGQIQTLASEVANLKARSSSKSRSSDSVYEKKGNYASAEDFFDKKEWKKAIVGYQKYRDLNPNGRRYADATYKIGVSFQELQMRDEAKAFYEEVIAKFPKSKEAQKAEYRLKKIK